MISHCRNNCRPGKTWHRAAVKCLTKVNDGLSPKYLRDPHYLTPPTRYVWPGMGGVKLYGVDGLSSVSTFIEVLQCGECATTNSKQISSTTARRGLLRA
jgi:hypothetical protein